MKDKIEKLFSTCKASVHITYNEHKAYYDTIHDLLSKQKLEDIDKDVFDEMIRRDCVIQIQFYPDTPIGSYSIYHYDLETALDEALAVLAENQI